MRLSAGIVAMLALAGTAEAATPAPGAPGAVANWTRGDKDGFGTSRSLESKAWYTLAGGELTEVYAPDLGTPSFRDLQFAVSDGRTFTERETDVASETRMVGPLVYRQVTTAERWRIVKTYVTDPARASVLVRVKFSGDRGLKLYVLADPALSGGGDDDRGRGLVAWDAKHASALAGPFRRASSGYVGSSDGWTDLQDHRLDWSYEAAEPGNVAQVAEVARDEFTLALGFGATPAAAERTADASLRTGFDRARDHYADGWERYLRGLDRPRSVRGLEREYDASLLVMAATEDKTYRGALIAAPSMPWVWGNLAGYSGPYHLVWSRDVYQVATGQLAAGDRAAAARAVDYLWTRQQKPDGCFPQNSNLDGSPHWPNLQLDEVADPIILSWQLRQTGARIWSHVRRAAECIIREGPVTQERWENAIGYSPASIGAAIAGLVTAADLGARHDRAAAERYLAVADDWQRRVDEWTVTGNGPLSTERYYLRLTVDGQPGTGTEYTIADGGPTVDQRAVVDTSFLELVRLGVKPWDHPAVLTSLPVVDRELAVDTPNGRFWHRFNHDGYGELPDGGPFGTPGNIGRAWPIFAGERGEYELLAGGSARDRLRAMAATANDGLLMPEQVWDENPPSGRPGYEPGTGTFSATPLGWTHAQFVRLAWSIDAGRPVEQPKVVACRYVRECGSG